MTGFEAGDVVYDTEEPETLGIVTHDGARSVTVVWSHGGKEAGPGLLNRLKHIEPRVSLDVPILALGYLSCNREHAVTAALRRAGLMGANS